VLGYHATERSSCDVDGAQPLGVQQGRQSIRHVVETRYRRIIRNQDTKIGPDSKSGQESELTNAQGPG